MTAVHVPNDRCTGTSTCDIGRNMLLLLKDVQMHMGAVHCTVSGDTCKGAHNSCTGADDCCTGSDDSRTGRDKYVNNQTIAVKAFIQITAV
jgi:uncharacterized protein (DUF779 family)